MSTVASPPHRADAVRTTPLRFPGPAADRPAGEVTCWLPPHYASLRTVRDVVRRTLQDWRAEALVDDVVLVASELVANALQHGVGVDAGQAGRAGGVELSLVRNGSQIICVVHDPSDKAPAPRTPDVDSGSGRGLQLIDSLSSAWGWTALHSEGRPNGKSVWAVFHLGRSGGLLRPAVGAA